MEIKFSTDAVREKFENDKTHYKLVILIIASHSETYHFFMNCWKAYMNSFPDVKSFFLFSDENIDCDLLVTEDTITHKYVECNVPGITLKTTHGMEICNKFFIYDYMLRTNLSSFYHIPRLLSYLDTQSKSTYVGSQFYILPNVPQKQEEIVFVNNYFGKQLNDTFIFLHGAGFILSRDVVVNYCSEMKKGDPKINSTLTVADDVGISMVLYNFLSEPGHHESGMYFPPEFRSLYDNRYQCKQLLDPCVYDKDCLFHIRNKKDDSDSNNSLEHRQDDICNYILQVRYFYNMPNFMSDVGSILTNEAELSNDFVPFEHDVDEPTIFDNLTAISQKEQADANIQYNQDSPVPVPVAPVPYPPIEKSQDEFIPVKRSKLIVDGFTFYNEMEMLLYRLTVLNDVVDYFVICEATRTHTGKPKQLYYNENKEKYKEFQHKIIHVIVDDLIADADIEKNEQWANENAQRNAIDRGISQLSLLKDDLIIISDLDEIPDPTVLAELKLKAKQEFKVTSLRQKFYYYNLNSQNSETWLHPKIATYEGYITCESSPQNMRMHKSFYIIDKGGWHLSYFGDAKFVKNKLENFAHQEFNKEEYTNEKKLQERMDGFKDILNRSRCTITKISVKKNDYLPPRYEEFLSNFVLF